MPSPPRRSQPPPSPAAAKPGTFWERAIDPHGADLRVIRTKVEKNLARATDASLRPTLLGDTVPLDDRVRRTLLIDALGMLRYGLSLAPEDPWMLERAGFAAARLGRLQQARTLLTRYMRLEAAKRIAASTHARLGRIHARLREWDAAVIQLRISLELAASRPDSRAQAVVTLAGIYMHQQRLADAIALVMGELRGPAVMRGVYSGEPIVQLTLAVAYDRDEQRARANTVLTKMKQRGQLALSLLQQPVFNASTYAPIIDRHYFAALIYEAAGHSADARTEWLNYASSADARYRRHAQAHVADLDAATRKRLKSGKSRKRAPK